MTVIAADFPDRAGTLAVVMHVETDVQDAS